MKKNKVDGTDGARDVSKVEGLPALALTKQTTITRRSFLYFSGAGASVVALYGLGCGTTSTKGAGVLRDGWVDKATSLIVQDPSRCVGCRRCELACSEFNDGKAQPAVARIKVARNFNFGPSGSPTDLWKGEGKFGNHRIVQDTCLQCPHPVPCRLHCPYDAIEATGPDNARVINKEKCQGCKTCQGACPWGMPSFDQETNKATKCHLCDGSPECVRACPTGALQQIAWFDRTKIIPQRFDVYPEYPEGVGSTCSECH